MPPLYTFHCYDDDGAPIAMQAAQLPDDGAAADYAIHVLSEHLSAASVVVCDADREVATQQRTPPA